MQRIKIYPVHWLRLILFFLLAFLVISLFSCKVREKIVTKYEIIDTMFFVEKYEIKYDTLKLPADSAYIKAFFQCDSLGNVLIQELNEEKGKFKTKTVFKNNTLEVLINVDSSEIIRQAEERFLQKYNSTNKEIVETTKTKKTFNWYYYFGFGFIVGFIVKLLIRKVFNYFKNFIS